MNTFPEETMRRLADVVRQHLGLHFPPERWRDLARGMEAACRDLGEPGVEACTSKLAAGSLDRRQIEILGRSLTVGETYFFREEQAFQALESRFLPELLAARPRERILRLWSAACATGEEPYSLAILLHSRIPDIERWNVTVLATDINTEFLRKAREGIYRDWSFRTERGRQRERWFTRTAEGHYQVRPEIRRLVTFAYHNLAEDPYPALLNHTNAMDVIFCRNVLMYFSEERRQQVLDNLQLCLVTGGILVLGAAETSTRPGQGFIPIALSDLTVYQRQPTLPRPSHPPVSAPRAALPKAPPVRPPAPDASQPASPLPIIAAAFDRGDYAEVCRLGAALRPVDADFTAAALLCARACANLGRLPDALAWVEKVIARRRFDPDAHYLGAMIMDEQGRTAEGLNALRTTLFLDPDFVPAYVALGNIHRRQGERRQAERNFRNALVLLERYADDDPVPHAEEMRAGRLREAVIAALGGSGGTT